jgi:hypothetical protein
MMRWVLRLVETGAEDGGALFLFEGATWRRERALECLYLPRIETQDFNGGEALRYV